MQSAGHDMNTQRTVEGGCHCGNVAVRVELTGDPASYEPRSCDCDFCRMHGAAYISDPRGRLRIRIKEENHFGRYRQGAEKADMLLCASCGVLVGACYQETDQLFGVVNVRILSGEFGTPVNASPKRLGPEEKTQRWKKIWFGDVRLMQHLNECLRQELVAMAERDLAVREELVAEGSLASQGYHPRMEAMHKDNASRLAHIIAQHGWPGESLVGEDGARAAWLVAQHAIGDPPFMRRSLMLLKQAAARREVPQWQVAMMEDRIRMYEGRPQVYGTQFQPDGNGELVPYMIEDPSNVNDRRRAAGLNSLEERILEMRKQSAEEKLSLPPNWEAEYEKWLYSVGWRE